jgi:ferredoxin-NADP reductase
MEYTIKLISKEHIENAYYVFDFEKPEGFIFIEGQFGKFELFNKDIDDRNFRIFSIASTCDESIIRISTRIIDVPSLYKKELLSMELGEEIKLSAPIGKFTLEVDSKAVFIAGGIGITPIRSMLLSNKCRKHNYVDELIYSELEKCYPFKDELEALDKLNISYAADIEPTQKLIRDTANKNKNEAFYYISGSPGFVKGISGILRENGVDSRRIKFDVFTGY